MFFLISKKYLALVAMAVIFRPTALIVWFPLLMYHFWKEDNKQRLITHSYIPLGCVHYQPDPLTTVFFFYYHSSDHFLSRLQGVSCYDFNHY